MSRTLAWDGQGALHPAAPPGAPARGELLVGVTHTLCIPGAPPWPASACGQVLDGGPQTQLGRDTRVVFATRSIASHVLVPETSCFVTSLPAASALFLPPVADLLKALDTCMPDLGWNAIVTGTDPLARLFVRVLTGCGARRVACQVAEGEDMPTGATDAFTTLSRSQPGGLAATVATRSGPVLFLETTGRASVLQSILDVIPAHGMLVLAGHTPGDVTSLNVYADVHKKNIRIVGAAAGLDMQRGLRAERLLQRRVSVPTLSTAWALPETALPQATEGFVLSWSQPSS